MEKHEVTVKGENVDILNILKRLRKKYSKYIELISPELPKTQKEEETKKEVWVLPEYLILMYHNLCKIDIPF